MSDVLYDRPYHNDPPELPPDDRHAAGLAELDRLLAAADEAGELFVIPIQPGVIRWLLRGEFHRAGGVARVIGGRVGGQVTGRDFTPYFEEIFDPRGLVLVDVDPSGLDR